MTILLHLALIVGGENVRWYINPRLITQLTAANDGCLVTVTGEVRRVTEICSEVQRRIRNAK